MKFIVASVLTLFTLSSLADCRVNINDLKDDGPKRFGKLNKQLAKKGYQVSEEDNTPYALYKMSSYAEELGSAKVLVEFSFDKERETMATQETFIRENVLGLFNQAKE